MLSKISTPATDDTPMMRQYQSIKKDHPDAILFFRMGDFYEMFNEDAIVASPILEIALTSRNKKQAQPIPMCGVPYHAANGYINKLVKRGKKVAICEQMEDPKSTKGLVKRDVIRIITPGTVLDDSMLDPKNHHHLVSIYTDSSGTGLAYIDLSTGLFQVTEFKSGSSIFIDEIEKLDPKEILIPSSMIQNADGDLSRWIQNHSFGFQTLEDWHFSYGDCERKLLDHFKTHSLEGFGCSDFKRAVCAAGALLSYILETQKASLEHINSISTFNIHNYMVLDQATVRNMELIKNIQGQRNGSLFQLLDFTCTPMGARILKGWILKPLVKLRDIEARLEIVDEFNNNPLLRQGFRERLQKVLDLERLLGRISLSICNPRDLISLKTSLENFPNILNCLQQCRSKALAFFIEHWDNLENVYEPIDRQIVNEPPFNPKDGPVIKTGCHEELDKLKKVCLEGKNWIASLEFKERERTGIPLLKIGYNKIYGYYIEVTKKNLERVPDEYIRKQSLVNTERFISPELKQYEENISGAEEKMQAIESEIFQTLRKFIASQGARIQQMASLLGKLDAMLSFAEAAHQFNYCRPLVGEFAHLKIKTGRHPLIESLGMENQFIPNDTQLDCQENQILIITGPNMAGKSTYLRQVALITLMAQIGSFVPAECAEIGIVDRIFSRVGAQDNLLKGQSTFMVEMNETANILNHATDKSLIVLDEIGRGTSTFDGISIAWSIVEYLHSAENIGAKTLFATHYHELTDLSKILTGAKNYNIQVKEWNDEIIFLRKIAEGSADQSYGIQVARLAGLPERVLKRAKEVLMNLENKELDEVGAPVIGHSVEVSKITSPQQLYLFHEQNNYLIQKLMEIDPENLTPKQALDLVFEFKQFIKRQQ